ncbi:hypothetical protein M438DRAFT_369928 [Aureobasidium pullulans EXF-150]|uniref:Uncharacterized protein n=1 Tax=Aureobasidium pullulans EXF-150 TaxID=1043002 RepID=A0A074X0C1_AURPU|nr:uncharacterized protein M438DRAFT_369928 [Aureobasidium pullulans EXF-150]KEQ78863.1 hypothetical protein M438DRAFT_369928 [Aureobasidium pullulans EXF-150]
MPSKRRRLASPPRHGLSFNFDLDTNALPPPSVTRDRGAPPGTKSFSRDITLYKPEIAKAAQIEFSEPSDQTKAIMRYAIERPAVDRTLASISEPRLYSEGGISRAITATAAGPAVEAGAEHNNKKILDPLSGEAPDAKPTPVATVMTAKELTARKHHDELQEEKRVQHNHSAQIAARSRGKRLAEALDKIEEGDLQASGVDRGYVARVDPSPAVRPITPHRTSPWLKSILKSETRGTAPPTKRVHFLTLETLVDHTSKHLERYNNKRISGPVLSISFALVHASLSSSPPNSAKLLSALQDFKAAVEKSLRLLQAFVQIAAGTTSSITDAKTWNMARGQFALSRRYLRLFKWIDFSQASTITWTSSPPSSRRVLATAKNMLLAIYFFMEMFCITNAMGITTSSFLTALQHHALQVWFFAISTSLLLTTHDYLSQNMSSATLASDLVLDCCDILIPGSAVGWIPVDSVTVGIASSISSIIAGQQIWARVQKEAKDKEMRKREKSMRKVRFEKGTKVSEEEEELSEKEGKEEEASNGVVDGSVKVLANAAGGANGGVKKRSKKA